MSGIFGLLGVNDHDYQYVQQLGQRLVFETTQTWLQKYNADLEAAMSLFVQTTTEDYKERYKLPGGGRLQRRGGLAVSAAVKARGKWDVAYPLEEFGDQIAADTVELAYMSPQEYQVHLDTVTIQDTNTVRHEILRALFNSQARTFEDDHRGTLTIQPLANGDSVVYPPVLGSESEATDTHYLESGYAASAISDTNNPLETMREELDEHFGTSTGGDNVVVFINQAQAAKLKALTDFTEVPDRFIRQGDNADVPVNLPNVPGKLLGRGSGVWVIEWRWIPQNYLLGLHLDAPAPLKMRVDPASTGLPRGLALVAEDKEYPLQSAHWRHRFGVGVANRLNGVVMELGTGGSYSVPSGY